MLSDLVRYFTLTDDVVYEDTDLSQFMRYVHRHTLDDEIRNAIEVAVHNASDGFIDLYDYGFNEENYLNDQHLGDVLNLYYDNVLVTMILSCVMHTMHFDVHYEDYEMAIALDGEDDYESGKYRISNFEPYYGNRKVDRYINDFIGEVFKDFEDCDNEGYIDQYTAETQRFIVSRIILKDKSKARKLRKAYAKNSLVRELLNELKYFMVNGEFVFVESYNVEEIGYDGGFDMEAIYYGMDELIEIFGNDQLNDESVSFKKSLDRLNGYLCDYGNSAKYNYRFFRKIRECHIAAGGEVIL